jgi:hypothetical protein
MAVVSGTFRTGNARVNREELSGEVNLIDPQDTPIYSMIKGPRCGAVNPQWAIESMDPPGDNIHEEGAEYQFDTTDPVVRVSNYTQIFQKTGVVSRTQDMVDNAGKLEQTARKKLIKGVEMRKDVEFSIVNNAASVAGNVRRSGGLPSWITSNVARNSGSNGGFNTGTGLTVAAGNGTQRAFTKVLTDGVMQAGYTNGANFKYLVVSPYVKSVFVTFMSDTNVAAYRYAADSGKGNSIIANADFYEGPFGKVAIVPNRVMATSAAVARNAFFIDPAYLKWAWLKGGAITEDTEVAKTGDANKFVLIGEGTLCPKNEKGLGVVADLFGLTASS